MVYLEQMKINNIPYMTRDLSIKLYEQIRIFTYLYAQSLSHVEDTIKDHMKESPYPYTKKEIENMKRYIPEYEELFKKNTIPSSHKKTYEQLKKTL